MQRRPSEAGERGLSWSPRQLSKLILRALHCLTLALLLALAGPAAADPADATDEAFGLLLAMPGTQPVEGGWIVPQEPAASEQDLIAQWAQLRKAGANFNAMRHQGTLLAHTIRAGKDRAALWLLRNGADPRKGVLDGSEDAYALALKYQRTAVIQALERQGAGKAARAVSAPALPPAAQPSVVPAIAAPRTRTRIEEAAAEMERLVGNTRQPTVQAQQTWQRDAAALSRDEFQALIQAPGNLGKLVVLTRDLDGALDEALSRLPPELVRAQAQVIADLLAEWSYVTYAADPKRITYTGASRAWPALWKRIDKPLNYAARPDLAGRVPPALWPQLFASGYAQRDPAVTGCLLAAVDLPGLQALWPDFQRHFAQARDEAPGLVLAAWRLSRERDPCYYGSTQAETAQKLAWLRAQGVTQPVPGLRQRGPDEGVDPALEQMLAAFTPQGPLTARLVSVPTRCELDLSETWLDALARLRTVGWGVPAERVRIIEVPERKTCGLVISGESFPDFPRLSDSFASGPFRDPPTPRCADTPEDAEIWTLERDGPRRVDAGDATRGTGFGALHPVRDLQTGKRYWLDGGLTGAACSLSAQLPGAYEWQAGPSGHQLARSPDAALLERLLQQQCQRASGDTDVTCPGLGGPTDDALDGKPLLQRLRDGATVPLPALLEAMGTERRAAYRAALAARDHATLRSLLAQGIPAVWTAAELQALSRAELPLQDKRRRIALLFADADQLAAALKANGQLPDLGWVPRPDWGPILRLIGKSPEAWYEVAAQLRAGASADVACDIDRAQGFLCGGGLKPEQ